MQATSGSMPHDVTARVHFVGICGKAMGAIAIALAEAGHVVTGSDEHPYPPMSDLLARAGIVASTPFSPNNLPADVGVVVVGRRLLDDNPETHAARQRGLRCVSFPVLLRDWFLHRTRNLVVGGGVGKTTTAAMLTWVLERRGCRPDFLIGGIPAGLEWPARFRGSPLCVIEGDEYASAADDPTPKFLYYRPETLILTNTIEDHPDLYPDRESLLEAFRAAVQLLPADGGLILDETDAATAMLSQVARCQVTTIGETPAAMARITSLRLTPSGSSFRLRGVRFNLQSFGRMSVRNAAMAALAAERVGVPLEQAAHALSTFRDVSNRQEVVEVGTTALVLDKATHPASIAELHEALRQRYPDRRITVVIRPRATGGCGWIYQRDLPAALLSFDRVVIAPSYEHRPPADTRWQHTPFSVELLIAQLGVSGCEARITNDGGVAAAVLDLLGDREVVLLLLPEAHAAEAVQIAGALSIVGSAAGSAVATVQAE